jgi:hypothetical protein
MAQDGIRGLPARSNIHRTLAKTTHAMADFHIKAIGKWRLRKKQMGPPRTMKAVPSTANIKEKMKTVPSKKANVLRCQGFILSDFNAWL